MNKTSQHGNTASEINNSNSRRGPTLTSCLAEGRIKSSLTLTPLSSSPPTASESEWWALTVPWPVCTLVSVPWCQPWGTPKDKQKTQAAYLPKATRCRSKRFQYFAHSALPKCDPSSFIQIYSLLFVPGWLLFSNRDVANSFQSIGF